MVAVLNLATLPNCDDGRLMWPLVRLDVLDAICIIEQQARPRELRITLGVLVESPLDAVLLCLQCLHHHRDGKLAHCLPLVIFDLVLKGMLRFL